MRSKEIKCPCCEKTYVEEYDICPECGWENDPVQMSKPVNCKGCK